MKRLRHGIRRDAIEEIILAKIKETVALAIKNKDSFGKLVNKQVNKDTKKAIKSKSAEFAKAERRITELDNIISRIYEDNVSGKLSDE